MGEEDAAREEINLPEQYDAEIGDCCHDVYAEIVKTPWNLAHDGVFKVWVGLEERWALRTIRQSTPASRGRRVLKVELDQCSPQVDVRGLHTVAAVSPLF